MKRRIPHILLASLLLLALLSGCAGTDRPLHAQKKALQDSDAARLLNIFVQNYTVFDLSFGKGHTATLEIVFFENGKTAGSIEVGPMETDDSGDYALSLMQYQSSSDAAYKAAILQMDKGASYTMPFLPQSSEGLHGAKYALSQEYTAEELPVGGRFPLYGVFYTGSTNIPAEPSIEQGIADAALSAVFYITIQGATAQ